MAVFTLLAAKWLATRGRHCSTDPDQVEGVLLVVVVLAGWGSKYQGWRSLMSARSASSCAVRP